MALIHTIKSDPVRIGAGMVVFVPEMLENLADFAQRVYAQAVAQDRWVLYLAVITRETYPLTAARQLATITALTQGSSVTVRTLQVRVEDWADTLRQVTHPGDIVIWPGAELLAPASLENELGITQQVLPVSCTKAASQPQPWLRTAIFWLSGLLILIGFSFLEFQLGSQISGAPLKAALILLFTFEIVLLYQLNRISS